MEPCRELTENLVLDNSIREHSLYKIPLKHGSLEEDNGVLNPEDSVSIQIFVRGDKMGKHILKFLFGYQGVVRGIV